MVTMTTRTNLPEAVPWHQQDSTLPSHGPIQLGLAR